jgi:hypothetical protein
MSLGETIRWRPSSLEFKGGESGHGSVLWPRYAV